MKFKVLFNCVKCNQPVDYERTNRQIVGHSVKCPHCRHINKVSATGDKITALK